MSLLETYAALPYVAHAYPQSDPARFGVVGHLAGLSPKLPSKARILEIGCAVGGNLAPLAARYPNAECMGIDLSPEQVDAAVIRDSKATYSARDLCTLASTDGPFDYVIAHGVYSWVPSAVRDVLFQRIREVLAPTGLAYVSYNVLPGWYGRLAIRDVMLARTASVSGPLEKVRAARQILALLANNATEGPHRDALREEAARIRNEPDAWLFHDYLEVFNTPVTYRHVVEHARRDGLATLGDAALHTSQLRSLDETADSLLKQWSDDAVTYETYLDTLRNRTFRQTVFAHANSPLSSDVGPGHLHGLHLRTQLLSDGEGRFTDGTRSIAAQDPSMTTLLDHLGSAHPGSAEFTPDQPDDIAARAFFGISTGAITASLEPVAAVRPSRAPRLWQGAMDMAKRGETALTNLAHETVELPEDVLQVARRLDGRKKPRPGWSKALGVLAAHAFLDA
ncbi:MAG: trans-aconitate methyltransferase [Myxococcota bacterium]|jgi:trans-aconitate methyltransferase